MTENDADSTASASADDASTDVDPRPAAWSDVRQLPALIAGLLLLGMGGLMMLPRHEPPEYASHFNHVLRLMKANNYVDAETRLNGMKELIAEAPQEMRSMYWLLWGDLNYRWQRYESINLPYKNEQVVRHYRQAEQMGRPLDTERLQRLATTLVMLDRVDEALQLLDHMEHAEPAQRYELIRTAIERRLEDVRDDQIRIAGLMRLIDRFLDEVNHEMAPTALRNAQIWATGLQAHLMLTADDPRRAIEHLQRRMIHFLDDGGGKGLPPLMVLLGESYQRLGDFAEARRWLSETQRRLTPGVDLDMHAMVLVRKGQVDLACSQVRAARELFAAAASRYPGAPVFLDALTGKADCEARLGVHTEALKDFRHAVGTLVNDDADNAEVRMRIAGGLTGHYTLNMDYGEYDLALKYLSLVKPLFEDGLPSDLVERFAIVHGKMGQARKEDAAQTAQNAQLTAKERHATRTLANQEAAIHFEKAADAWREHARTVIARDEKEYADSLWKAAQNFDRAQLWGRAIDVYSEYVIVHADDPRCLTALNRLGMAYTADGQYAPAIEQFRTIVDDHPQTPESYDSLVPLARAYLASDQFDAAQRVLLHVLTDHPALTPESVQYRQALVEIGKLHYLRPEFEKAIIWLDQAVLLHRDQPAEPSLLYYLADANRQSVDQIDQALQHPMPPNQKATHEQERRRRLEAAMSRYDAVIEKLEPITDAELTSTEILFRRNAYFFRADCAYALRNFDAAIRLYDQAARRWERDPASMTALIQIVNAYCEQGQIQQAKVANDWAQQHLNRIPEDAFDDPNLPMSKEHWQQWLRWSSELNLFETQAKAR